MRLISFDLLRTMSISGVIHIKPEHYLRELPALLEAECVLFPQYWQVNGLVYGLKRRIFPSVASYHIGHDKIEQTRAFLTVCPANLPQTEILPSCASSIEQVLEQFDFPLVAKVARSSMGQGVFLIESRRELLDYAANNAVLYIQEYLPITRDLRVVWIGNQVVTAYWREQTNGFHNNVAMGGVITFDRVPPAAIELVTHVATTLGIDHAGFDVAVVAGHCYLLEMNVLFGLEGVHRQGIDYSQHIVRYLRGDDDEPPKPLHPHSPTAVA